jgi:hypothetical protein
MPVDVYLLTAAEGYRWLVLDDRIRVDEMTDGRRLGATYPPLRVKPLDDRSEVKRFRSGRIMRVLHYELRREEIEPAAVFKLVEPRPDVYVTDTFRAAVEAAGLQGLAWDRLVWSDDPERAAQGAGRLDLHV